MLRRILTFVIAIILTVTGLILMETILPHISFLIGYDVHSRGVLGYSYIHWLFALLGVLFFGWVGWVITPFIIKFILKYSDHCLSCFQYEASRKQSFPWGICKPRFFRNYPPHFRQPSMPQDFPFPEECTAASARVIHCPHRQAS